jgi:hypothetical protein
MNPRAMARDSNEGVPFICFRLVMSVSALAISPFGKRIISAAQPAISAFVFLQEKWNNTFASAGLLARLLTCCAPEVWVRALDLTKRNRMW